VSASYAESAFLLCDAMRKRGLYCRPCVPPSVRPSVRPLFVRLSVTFVYCIQTAKRYRQLFLSPVGHHSSYLTPNAGTQFPSAGAQDTRVAKFCDVPQKSPFISETIQDRTMVAMEA